MSFLSLFQVSVHSSVRGIYVANGSPGATNWRDTTGHTPARRTSSVRSATSGSCAPTTWPNTPNVIPSSGPTRFSSAARLTQEAGGRPLSQTPSDLWWSPLILTPRIARTRLKWLLATVAEVWRMSITLKEFPILSSDWDDEQIRLRYY